MLSILIPIYNFDSSKLINEVHKQCISNSIIFEIRCYEDASTIHYKANEKTTFSLSNVTYKYLKTNLGRQDIRNKLAIEAQYDHLLFLDCDNVISQKDFIKNYLLQKSNFVYGGRNYPSQNKDSQFCLHYKYGKQRESLNANKRSKKPYRTFLSTNFLVNKMLFLSIPKYNNINGYGYEDSYIGDYLKKNKINITHIDNPATHIGLETNNDFLNKTMSAIQNLSTLYRKNDLNPQMVKLLMVYDTIKRKNILFIIKPILNALNKFFKANLLSKNPSLFVFDLYKLHLLTQKLK